ncbi:MAG TPA: succinate dehydrogenase, partial [Terriglobales bacterium]|nr:succinate dehydrogenase [Terriglobales bacterium]
GILCASWHFSYGLWLFAVKWGIVTGDRARRRLGYLALAIGLVFVGVGAATMYSFLNTPLEPLDVTGASMAMRQ